MDAGGRPLQIAGMFELKPPDFADKAEAYAALESELRALLHGERDFIANCANTAALLWHSLLDLNWAGFYRLVEGQLVLGPFQGKPAAGRIQLGKGVCGMAAATRQTVLVPDVHEFPGHIACDAASKSEIVVPLVKDGRLLGVLDLDSPKLNRFDTADQAGLEKLAEIIIAASDW
jgi:L-methionine (R)-S-oxide reductase